MFVETFYLFHSPQLYFLSRFEKSERLGRLDKIKLLIRVKAVCLFSFYQLYQRTNKMAKLSSQNFEPSNVCNSTSLQFLFPLAYFLLFSSRIVYTEGLIMRANLKYRNLSKQPDDYRSDKTCSKTIFYLLPSPEAKLLMFLEKAS